MARLFHPAYTITEYRVHLGRLLGLFEPLECAVDGTADPGDAVRGIQKSSALREDLGRMGSTSVEIEELERCSSIPLMTKAGLKGYSYVILGSMLGGKIIAKRLRYVLGPEASLRFYDDENERSEALWASFRQDLEDIGKHNLEAICSTAMGVFDVYAEWLS
jgi:heme oxygenase